MDRPESTAPDWAVLSHAYGTATDTPEHLAALRSADPLVRMNAWRELIGSTNHQGDLYPATPWIIEPLLDLALDRRYADRVSAAAHVTLIVEDLSYHVDLPTGPEYVSDSSSPAADNPKRYRLLIQCRQGLAGRASDAATLMSDDDHAIRLWATRILGVLVRAGVVGAARLTSCVDDPDPLLRALALWQLMITSPDVAATAAVESRSAKDAASDSLDHYMVQIVRLGTRRNAEESAKEILRLQDLVWPDFERASLHHVAESPLVFAVVLTGVGSEVELEALAAQ